MRVRLILIDPKVVELSIYNDIPHLVCPVVTDCKKAASALEWAVAEMLKRYKRFAERGVRDIKGYNKALIAGEKPMPQMVIIIDELADLMMVAPGDVEDSICRLAQLARAAGMHLVIATQRPSVNVVTGIIKANIPTRIAFSVASQVDSRTMIDHGGAEKLLGNGDMLFVPSGINKPMRVQGRLGLRRGGPRHRRLHQEPLRRRHLRRGHDRADGKRRPHRRRARGRRRGIRSPPARGRRNRRRGRSGVRLHAPAPHARRAMPAPAASSTKCSAAASSPRPTAPSPAPCSSPAKR